ncbi:hypothetical protein MAN_10714, partial [Metarhizium hybridum]
MRFRFVDDEKQDSGVQHRRRQQAKRKRLYRQRLKAKQNIDITEDQHTTTSEGVDIATRNGQTHHDNTPAESGECSGHDISAEDMFADHGDADASENCTVQDLCPDDEPAIPVGEVVAESPVPQTYVEDQAHPPHTDRQSDTEYATEKFVQQFLVGIQGCGAQKHQEFLTAHLEAEEANNHHGLAELFPHDVPHTLDKQDLLSSSMDGRDTLNRGKRAFMLKSLIRLLTSTVKSNSTTVAFATWWN